MPKINWRNLVLAVIVFLMPLSSLLPVQPVQAEEVVVADQPQATDSQGNVVPDPVYGPNEVPWQPAVPEGMVVAAGSNVPQIAASPEWLRRKDRAQAKLFWKDVQSPFAVHYQMYHDGKMKQEGEYRVTTGSSPSEGVRLFYAEGWNVQYGQNLTVTLRGPDFYLTFLFQVPEHAPLFGRSYAVNNGCGTPMTVSTEGFIDPWIFREVGPTINGPWQFVDFTEVKDEPWVLGPTPVGSDWPDNFYVRTSYFGDKEKTYERGVNIAGSFTKPVCDTPTPTPTPTLIPSSCTDFIVQPKSGEVPLRVGASINGTNVQSGVLNWADGSAEEAVALSETIFHTFTTPGTYTVTGLVIDAAGNRITSSACQAVVTVIEKPDIPEFVGCETVTPVYDWERGTVSGNTTGKGAGWRIYPVVESQQIDTASNSFGGLPITKDGYEIRWFGADGVESGNVCRFAPSYLYFSVMFKPQDAPKVGGLEISKVVNWYTYTIDSSVMFTLSIVGPSFPEGAQQTVGFNGGTVRWENLIPGQYSIHEIGAGNRWVAQVLSNTLTVVAGQTVGTTIINDYSPEFCGTAVALDPAKLPLGRHLTPPGFINLKWTGYTHVTGPVERWLPAIVNPDGRVRVEVLLKPFKKQTFVGGVRVDGVQIDPHSDMVDKDFWMYTRLRPIVDNSRGRFPAWEVQYYLPCTGGTSGIFVEWQNEVGSASTEQFEEYAEIADPQ